MDPRKLVRIEGLLLVLLLLPLTEGGATNEDKNQASESDLPATLEVSDLEEKAANNYYGYRAADADLNQFDGKQILYDSTDEAADESATCEDTYVSPKDCIAWAARGECQKNPIWMSANCAKSCGKCGGSNTKKDSDCKDLNEHCPQWQKANECKKNPGYMEPNCPKSCGLCTGSTDETTDNSATCKDTHVSPKDCIAWAARGECQKNPIWMSANCAKSCGKCGGSTDETTDNSATCKDTHVSPKDCIAWAARGECQKNPIWMSANCAKSCGKCGGSTDETTDNSATCKDTHVSPKDCIAWAARGECQKNPIWMSANCAKSCGKCGGSNTKKDSDCKDLNEHCPQWQKANECKKNPGYMEPNCPKSCGLCTDSTDETTDNSATCKDTHVSPKDCIAWAARGECQKNPIWMSANCAKSCGKCGGSTDETTDNSATCKDTYVSPKDCIAWAARGECQKNPIWMSANCAKSCGKCGGSTDETTDNSATCKDTHVSPKDCIAWAASGECQKNPIWMSANCAKSCGKCGGSNTKKDSDCKDLNEHCPQWQKANECKKNPGYMEPNCPKSCGLCTDSTDETTDNSATCKDTHVSPKDCIAWAASGECQKNPIWMSANCAKSCGKCGGSNTKKDSDCKDLNEHCPQWQKANECKKNPGYMEPNCPKSCGLCTDSTDETTDNSATCKDTHVSPKDCIAWAASGECQKNPIWMSANCAKSCGICSETNRKFF
ncbi:hypothetical protein SprV_0100375400 [Sparganum proliferum]